MSLKKWYWISARTSSISILLFSITPFTKKEVILLTVIVFISQVDANLVMKPVGGIMANRIKKSRQGRASGWYQAGNLGGVGLGGGVGLWLASHFNVLFAGCVLCAISVLSAFSILLIRDVQNDKEKRIVHELAELGKAILTKIKIPVVLFVILMLCIPIGTGAANNLWSAIATDWKTSADTVALVTGILGGLISALGCVAGGVIADR
jgi:hypothetical protein